MMVKEIYKSNFLNTTEIMLVCSGIRLSQIKMVTNPHYVYKNNNSKDIIKEMTWAIETVN